MTPPSGTCFVLGGAGFLGAALVAEAQRRGYRAVAVTRADYDAHAGQSCDVLINANGNSKKFLAAQDPKEEFDRSVRSVVRALHDFRSGCYVHLSTIDVYPEKSDPHGNAETATIDAARLSPYGLHKYLAEQLARYYAPAGLLFRLGGFVGPGLWKNSIYDLLRGRPLRVHPDSRYQYLHTRRLAEIVFDLLAAGVQGEVFNLAGDGTLALREIASWIPGVTLPDAAESLPLEHYEVNVEKLKRRLALPATRDTVRRFVADALAGKEPLR